MVARLAGPCVRRGSTRERPAFGSTCVVHAYRRASTVRNTMGMCVCENVAVGRWDGVPRRGFYRAVLTRCTALPADPISERDLRWIVRDRAIS
eukprot:4984036-Prymnesium_polylepis.2